MRRYLDRLVPIAAADQRGGAGGRLLRETARHLAVRMSFEDVIRVAQAKIDPARFARIADELKVKPDEPFAVIEFLKPGIEEMCSILPPRLARPILAYSERRGWLGRVYWGMEIKTTSVTGYLRFWLLAKLRRFRPRSHRFAEEQAAIEAWLGLIAEAAKLSGDLALEVAECARLIKGYGDTHKRGSDNYATIVERVVRPALAGDHAGRRRRSTRSPAPAPRRLPILKARAWRAASPRSASAPRSALRLNSAAASTSVPIPKFATFGGTLSRELRNRKDTSKH